MPASPGRPLIIGIATVDAVARTIDRFPAPGGLQTFDGLTMATGGCAVNTAIALARLGVGADIIARVGEDANGGFIAAELGRHGVDTSLLARDASSGTSYSFVAVHPGGERSFLHTTGANDKLCPEDIPDDTMQGRSLVFVTGMMVMRAMEGGAAAGVLGRARQAGARTMLDTVFVEGLSREEWSHRVGPCLPLLDDFVPSLAEARALSGRSDPEAAAKSFRDQGVGRVVIKLGDRGVLCLDEDGSVERVPALPVGRVVDATGAGDCWCAGYIAGGLGGESFGASAALGNAVAAMGVTGAGASGAVPRLEEVRAFMAGVGRRTED